MVKRNGKNREHLTALNVPHLRGKIKKTCANRPVSCVNGEVRTDFGSPFGSNGDDRRQRRKQGGAVGAAASRMQATAKQTLGAATRAVSPKVTERARILTEKSRRSDSIALPKNLLIAAWRLSGDGLALSVIACAMPQPGLRLPASASLSLASCWPLPQQLLPASAAGGGRRCCSQRERLSRGEAFAFPG